MDEGCEANADEMQVELFFIVIKWMYEGCTKDAFPMYEGCSDKIDGMALKSRPKTEPKVFLHNRPTNRNSQKSGPTDNTS